MKQFSLKKFLLILLIPVLFFPQQSKAFSVFAHMAVIDASWKKSIVPLLKQKYPNATDDQLKEAHSYAYGGSLMPDMGYFPFGSVYFTNLVHYVRTGDFMQNLLNQSQNLDEYAFALGALSHYLTDEYGHSLATNVAEPIVYPKVGAQFGKVVTYEQDPIYHSRMEFGFDVLQLSRGNYASQQYHDFIGFNVSKPVLERAFMLTYGQNLDDVFGGKLDLAISTFRWSVKNLLPGLTRTAWAIKKNEIKKTNPNMNSRKFHFRIKKREYYQKYGREHDKPTLRDRITAVIIKILPKIGPLRALKFDPPGPDAERLFIKSFDTVLVCYNGFLHTLQNGGKLPLRDIDFDTGKPTLFGEYGLADQTYSQMVIYLDKIKFADTTDPLKQNIVSFYSKADSTIEPPKKLYDWKATNKSFTRLKYCIPISADSLKYPTNAIDTIAPKTR